MAELPHLGLYRKGLAAALFLGPLLFLVDNLIHPEELKRDNEAEQLREIGRALRRLADRTLPRTLSVLMLRGGGARPGVSCVRRRRPTLGLLAGAAGVLGLIGLGGALALDGVTWGILGEVYGEHRSPEIENALQRRAGLRVDAALLLADPLWVGALVALATGAARERAVPVWAALLFSLGGVMVGIEGVVADNTYFIVSAAVLMLGSWALALPIWRMSDAEFAAGGPGPGSPRPETASTRGARLRGAPEPSLPTYCPYSGITTRNEGAIAGLAGPPLIRSLSAADRASDSNE